MEYDASHKASSVTSTSSSNSSIWDPLPSLYTGRADSVSSAYEFDDLQEPESFEGFGYDPLIQEKAVDNEKSFSDFLNSFFKAEVKKEEMMDHKVPSSSLKKRPLEVEDDDDDEEEKNRELLSDDQKRANHIASEQKRRNTIRGGFKELTEIIPTLKNINNSKSTILFKSVDYIKQLDKRNKALRERLSSLQAQAQAQAQQRKRKPVVNLHKKQLELLQQQLKAQQELLTKHNIHSIPLYTTHSSISIPAMDDTPVTSTNTSPTLLHASLPTVNNNHHHHHHHQHHQHYQHHQHQNNTTTTTSTTSTTSTIYKTPAALVIPADEWSTPSFNIPADHYQQQYQSSFRERLLSSGKLNHLRKDTNYL
ncbi:hypothetical protein BD770DRAFT_371750 [Pilaira anomala]|nr:hypothetical protein BD770DRAFT_371750 [Pilaira anomala]